MDWFLPFRWWDLVDLVVVTLMVWAILAWLRRTRARVAFLGLLALAPVYLAASVLELHLSLWILQGFLAVVVIVMVVVFQDDLRRFFEQVGTWGLGRRAEPPAPGAADTLVRTVARLAQTRTGALLVIPGRTPLDLHLEGGVSLDARLSEPLLLSLFDTSSPGHDGAVVLTRGRVTKFAVHLPLSTDRARLGAGGTRHAAALGLSERCDALCIVVSEERGTVSVARDGELRVLSHPEDLLSHLREFAAEGAVTAGRVRREFFTRSWPEAAAAVVLTLGLWLVFVPGSAMIDDVRMAPVTVENLPKGYEVVSIRPPQVEVVLSGSRRALVLAGANKLTVGVDAWYIQLGRRTFQISPGDVRHPPGLSVRALSPDQVRLDVRPLEAGAGPTS